MHISINITIVRQHKERREKIGLRKKEVLLLVRFLGFGIKSRVKAKESKSEDW
jgi:hypothetical protein